MVPTVDDEITTEQTASPEHALDSEEPQQSDNQLNYHEILEQQGRVHPYNLRNRSIWYLKTKETLRINVFIESCKWWLVCSSDKDYICENETVKEWGVTDYK